MKQYDVPVTDARNDTSMFTLNHKKHYQEILKHITAIGASLRLDMDIDMLLQRIARATCEALLFRHSALYLADNARYFHVCATSGVSPKEEAYLRQHPIPQAILSLLTIDEHRLSNSYFIPAMAPVWNNKALWEFFVVVDEGEKSQEASSSLSSSTYPDPADAHYLWQPEDLMIVPLRRADDTLMGFLVPDAPLDGCRPTVETMELLELFANQAAVVIEGARLYEETRQNNQERAAIIEIGRTLFAPEALRDLHTVYQTIYEQVRRVMPIDAFFVSRYTQPIDELVMDYLMDDDVLYPPYKYDTITPWLRKLLLREKPSYVFATDQEHTSFIDAHYQGKKPSMSMVGNQRPCQSSIFVPIHYGNEAIGLLSAQSYQPYVYTQRHVEMLQEIGVLAGIAIMNARLYTELREAVKQAQESEHLKNQFLMTASHELRTPLTAIQGYLELLNVHEAFLDDAKKKRFIVNAQRACDELILLLGNVMDTSHIDQDWVTLKLDAVPVLSAARLILEILDPIIVREKRAIEVNIAPTLAVRGDDLRLRQILLNIVGNALKYTPPLTKIAISAEVLPVENLFRRVSLTKQPVGATHFVVVAVRDWGPGIAIEDQQRLFTKYVRLPSTTTNQRGAGWGLYLCRRLVETMHGYIWVESKGIAGEGATFFIALPQTNGVA